MKKNDLDQPLQNPAGADSVNGATDSMDLSSVRPVAMIGDILGDVLQKSVQAFQTISAVQSNAISSAVSQIAPVVNTGPRMAVSESRPTDHQQGHRNSQTKLAEYHPWGRYEKKPADDISQSRKPANDISPSRNLTGDASPNRKTVEESSPVRRLASSTATDRKPSMASPDSDQESAKMFSKSQKIVEHEEKHTGVLRDAPSEISQAKPKYIEKKGPDGKGHVVAGEVNTDIDPVMGNPAATEKKATFVASSAMSDINRSDSDNQAGKNAMTVAQQARAEKNSQPGAMESPYNRDSVKMHSPGSVKMRNPAALFTVARVLSGARMIGSAARGAANLVGRSSTIGGGIRSVLYRATRMVRNAGHTTLADNLKGTQPQNGLSRTADLVASFVGIIGAAKGVTNAMSEMSLKLRNFSSQLNMQMARNEINAMNQQLGQAKRMGPQLAEWERNKGRMSIAGGDMYEGLLSVIMPPINMIASLVASLMETVVSLGSGARDFVLDITGKNGLDLGGNLAFLLAPLKVIRDHILKFLPAAPQQNDDLFMRNLTDLFNMNIPGPNAAPQINGPKMNLQIPQFIPQPVMFPGI